MIENGKTRLIIDAGPDFRQQMIREDIHRIDGILVTHSHHDHIGGLDDVRPFNFVQEKAMDIYSEEAAGDSIMRAYPYVFAKDKYPGAPEMIIHHINNQPFKINDLKIVPIRVMHNKMPILGFRFNDFTYITDASYISEKEKEKIIGTKYLVINALRKNKHISHFSLGEAIQLIDEMAPKRAYLTHLSHQMGLYKDMEKELPRNVFLAYDGLKIRV